jgi:3'-phosphoadenosine 5'-phosphosulfate (PAPS) 3'-phosphatase
MQSRELEHRLAVARDAVEAAGAALMQVRGATTYARNLSGDPYKTSVDRAAEAWVLEYLTAMFPHDRILAEEAFDRNKEPWTAATEYWTVDALDGTASFVDGFDGFCVQVAYIAHGVPLIGVIHEPARGASYWATRGGGAFRKTGSGEACRLAIKAQTAWPRAPVVVDSVFPRGVAGRFMESRGARFLECGSTGCKICRVAEGKAQLVIKPVRYKLWDVAPGDLIVAEAGGRLGQWDSSPVSYDSGNIYLRNMLAAPKGLFELAVRELASLSAESHR